MLTIKFVVSGECREYNYDDSQRDVANAFVKALIEDKACTSLMCIKADGSVVMYKREAEKCFAVEVLFSGSDKLYTYASKDAAKEGDKLLVYTYKGFDVVTCVKCTEVEKNILPTLTNRKTPSWIKGKVTMF